MKRNLWIVLSAVVVLCLVVCAAVSALKGGCVKLIECESGSFPMKCHWTFIATTITGVAGVVCALLTAVAPCKTGRRTGALATLAVIVATVVIASPAGIGTCAHAESVCHQTAAVVYVTCALAAVLCVLQAVRADPAQAERPKMQL